MVVGASNSSACKMLFFLFLSTGKVLLFGVRGNENFLHLDVLPLYVFEIPGLLPFLLLAYRLCKEECPNIIGL